MADDLNELFQRPEGAPDTPDFWKLSSLILKNDGRVDEAEDLDAIQEVYNAILAESGVTHETLHYVAEQRAYRLLGVKTAQEAAEKARLVGALAAMFVDGFTIGGAFEREAD